MTPEEIKNYFLKAKPEQQLQFLCKTVRRLDTLKNVTQLGNELAKIKYIEKNLAVKISPIIMAGALAALKAAKQERLQKCFLSLVRNSEQKLAEKIVKKFNEGSKEHTE